MTIHNILGGLNNSIAKPRRVWGKWRFERAYSNSRWQADFKLTETDEWTVSYLDDHSRLVPGSMVNHDPTAENTIQLLKTCISNYARPEQILTMKEHSSTQLDEAYPHSQNSVVETA